MTSSAPGSNPSRAYKGNPSTRLFIYDDAFEDVLGDDAEVSLLVETNAHEGPVYRRGELFFTTVPEAVDNPIEGFSRVAIKKVCLNTVPVSVETVRDPSNMANGMTLDAAGNLVICEQGTLSDSGAISQLNPDTDAHKRLVDEWFGLRFNSPNDVVVKRDGTVWFTDPAYGFQQGFKPKPTIGSYVYRFDPDTCALTVVADDFVRPNGLAFSPDESILYINDSGALLGSGSYHPENPHHIRAFDVTENGKRLINSRLFTVVTPGIPDGLKVDSEGRVYSSAANGVQVFSSEGLLLGLIAVDGVANFTFGGENGNQLYLCADDAIWVVAIAAKGVGF